MVELNFSSDLKKFLFSLRKKEIINEKNFVQALDELKYPSKTVQNQLIPLLDMFGLIHLDMELQRLDQSLMKTESKIKETIHVWETRQLSKNETKATLTELVLQKNKLTLNQEKLQFRIQTKVKRLKLLKKTSNVGLESFVSTFLQESETEVISNLGNYFNNVWLKYSTGVMKEEMIEQAPSRLDDVELEILESLIVPITDETGVVFDLEDVIKPVESKNNLGSSLLGFKNQKEKLPVKDSEELLDAVQEQKTPSPWDLVGKIAYDATNKSIGLFRPPIVVKDTIYLPIVREESLSLSTLKKTYKKFLNQVDLDLDITTIQQIKSTIAKTLKIPEELALQPSFFNQWAGTIGNEVTPASPQLKNVWFIEENVIQQLSSDNPIVKNEELKKITVPAWIPAKGEEVSNSTYIGQRIIGMAGSDFGSIVGILHDTPFGQSLIIERKVPSSYLLDLFLKGLSVRNLSELRFNLAKKQNIGEGEAFFAKSLWNVNNQERLLISPHEIAVSYFSVLPAAAFAFSELVRAKIGVYFHSIPETFRYLIGKPLIESGEEKGLIYGFSVLQGDLFVLWSSKNAIEMIKELGRKSSEHYVNRFQRRVALALDIPPKESMWLSNLARYFLNFIWMEEDQTLEKAFAVIEERFSLQKVSFSEILEIHKDGLSCRTNHG